MRQLPWQLKQLKTLTPLTSKHLLVLRGGVNWDRVYAGASVYGGATLAIGLASGPIGWVAATAYLGTCAASGAYIGYGLAT